MELNFTVVLFIVSAIIFLGALWYLKNTLAKVKKLKNEVAEENIRLKTFLDNARREAVEIIDRDTKEYYERSRAEAAEHLALYYENESLKAKTVLDKYIAFAQQEIDNTSQELFQFRNEVETIQSQLTSDTQDMASRLVAVVESERSLFLEKEELNAKTIQLSIEDQEDISFLLKEIVPKIRRPEVLRKLIWAEYVQKPTAELLNNILPQDCSGIYKITHLPDKKCYVGRSTSVRKRLIEHIKSSLGVGTIADQAVHHAMRNNGLQNFMFELVEECDRTILPEREKFYIETFQSNTHGWNKNIGG